MRLFLTTYNKTGTHQIMPALRIFNDVEDRSNNSLSYVSRYVPDRIDAYIDDEGVKRTCEDLKSFEVHAFGHLSYMPEFVDALQTRPTKVIFNVRDPRDVIVAELHNMMKHGYNSWLNFPLIDKSCYVSDDDPISHLIDFATRWYRWIGWLDHDFVYKVKYEDLRLHPEETVVDMWKWLGDDYRIDTGAVVRGLLPKDHNPTFRKGAVGDWKEHFTDAHKKKAEEMLGEIITLLGYDL